MFFSVNSRAKISSYNASCSALFVESEPLSLSASKTQTALSVSRASCAISPLHPPSDSLQPCTADAGTGAEKFLFPTAEHAKVRNQTHADFQRAITSHFRFRSSKYARDLCNVIRKDSFYIIFDRQGHYLRGPFPIFQCAYGCPACAHLSQRSFRHSFSVPPKFPADLHCPFYISFDVRGSPKSP